MRLGVAAALAGALTMVSAPALGQAGQAGVTETLDLHPGETLLEINATGMSRNVADILSLSIGVSLTGATAQEAMDAVTERMNAVLAAVRAVGIEAADIQTNEFRVEPQIEDDNRRTGYAGPPRVLGYEASNGIKLQLRDFDGVTQLMEAVFAAGANDISNPSFSLDDNSNAMRTARDDAARIARADAEAYAATFGMRIARIIRISERGSRSEFRRPITVTATRVSHGVQIFPGEIETEVDLWVDYALVPQ